MRIVGYLLVGLVALIVAASVGLALFANSSLARSQFEVALSEALGREVHIGAQQIVWGSTLTLTIDDARIAAPAWSKSSNFVAFNKLQATVKLSALFEQPIRLQSLDISGLTLHLEQLDDGRASWSFDVRDDEPESSDRSETAGPLLPVLIEQAQLIGTEISLQIPDAPIRHLRADINQVLHSDTLTINLSGSLIKTAATNDEQSTAIPLAFTVGATPVKQLIDLGAAELTFHGQLGEMDINLSADIDDVSTLEHVAATLDLSGPSAAKIGALAGQDGLPDSPFTVAAAITRAKQKLDIHHSRLTVGKIVLDVSGTLPDLSTPTHADLEATLDLPELQALAAVFALPPQISGPLSGSVTVSAHDADADVKGNVSTNYGSAAFNGKFMRSPSLTGSELTIELFDDNIAHLLALLPTATEDPQQLEHTLMGTLTGPWQFQTQLHIAQEQYQLRQGTVSLDKDRLAFSIDINRVAPAEGIAFTLDGSIAKLQRYLSSVLDAESLALIPQAPLSLKTSGALNARTLTLHPTTFSLAGLEGEFTGTTHLETADTTVGFTLTSERPSAWVPLDLLPNAFNQTALQLPFSADGALHFNAGQFALNAHRITLGENVLSGDVGLNTTSDHLSVALDFTSPNIFMFANEDVDVGGQQLPVTATIKLGLQQGRVDIDAMEVTAEGGTIISARGDLRFGDSFDGTDFDVDARVASLQHLGFLLGADLPDAPLALSADISGDLRHVVAKNFSVTLGESVIAGHLQVANPARPSVELTLQSELLDLRPLIPALTQTTKATPEPARSNTEGLQQVEREGMASPQSKSGITEATDIKTDKRLIPDTPIDLSPLDRFDAVVDLDIKRVVGHARYLQDVALDVEVRDGALHLKNLSLTDEETGAINIVGFARPSGDSHRVSINAVGKGMNLDFSTAKSSQQDTITRVDFDALLFGEANNLRDLLSTGHGFIQVESGKGRLPKLPSGMLTNDVLDELLNTLNPFRKQQTNTVLRCGALVGSLENGRLVGQPLFTMVTDRLAIVSNAQIDMTTEKLFATFKSVPQRGVGISATTALNSFVAVGGTLAKPELTVDPTGTIVKGGLAFMTGGLSLLGEGLIDRATTGTSACDKALASASKTRLRIEAMQADFH